MRKNINKFLIVFLGIFILSSCNNSNNQTNADLDDYTIEKGEIINDYKIAKLSYDYLPSTDYNITFKQYWNFSSETILLFDFDCKMNKEQLACFMSTYQNFNYEFGERIESTGTGLFTFSKKNQSTTPLVTMDASTKGLDTTKKYAFYYVGDVLEYKVTDKKDNSKFTLYLTSSGLMIDFLAN